MALGERVLIADVRLSSGRRRERSFKVSDVRADLRSSYGRVTSYRSWNTQYLGRSIVQESSENNGLIKRTHLGIYLAVRTAVK